MEIFKEKILVILSALSGAFLFFGLVLIYFNIHNFSLPVILHFDAFRGIDLFGERVDVWGIWFTGLIAILVNTYLAEVLFYRERVLSYLFIGANFLLALLVLIISGVIVSVN